MMTRLDTINEIHKHIPFFRERWEQFCKMVEDYGEHVEKCRSDPKLRIDTEKEMKQNDKLNKLWREHNVLIREFNKATQKGDLVAAKKYDKRRQKKEAELKKLEAKTPPPEPGYVWYQYWDFKYLNIPMGQIFWITEGPVNPLLWFNFFGNATNQRKPNKKETSIIDCAILSVLHDYSGDLSYSEETITERDKPYSGKYFQRNNFCQDLDTHLNSKVGTARIQRALDCVKDVLEKPVKTKQGKDVTKDAIPYEIDLMKQIAEHLKIWFQEDPGDKNYPSGTVDLRLRNGISLAVELVSFDKVLTWLRFNDQKEIARSLEKERDSFLSDLQAVEQAIERGDNPPLELIELRSKITGLIGTLEHTAKAFAGKLVAGKPEGPGQSQRAETPSEIELMEQFTKKLKTWADQNKKLIRKFSASLTGPLPPMDYERVVAYLQLNNPDMAGLVQGHYGELITCAKKIDTLTADGSRSALETATLLVGKLGFLANRLAQTLEVAVRHLTAERPAGAGQRNEQRQREFLLETAEKVSTWIINEVIMKRFKEQAKAFYDEITDWECKEDKEQTTHPVDRLVLPYATVSKAHIGLLIDDDYLKHLSIPFDKEKSLQADYVLLTIIHDKRLKNPRTPPISDGIWSKDEEWVECKYRELVEGYNYGSENMQTHIELTLKRVKADIDKLPTGTARNIPKKKTTKDRFSFAPGQVLFDGKDLNLPSGEPTGMCKILVGQFGQTIPYKTFDKNYSSAVPGSLPKSASIIRKHFKQANVPCEIVAKKTEGYLIRETHPKSKHKRVRK